MSVRKPLQPVQTILLRTLGIATLGIMGAAAGVAWYASNRVNPSRIRSYMDDYTFTPWELNIPFEDITLYSADGLKLRAWWLANPQSERVVVAAHGHTGAKHEMLGVGSSLWRAGYNVLLFDFRGRGSSDDAPNTLAYREVDDMHAAINYALERVPNAQLGVIGFSMGAAVSILTAASQPKVKAVIADSPFATASDVILNSMRNTLRITPAPLLTATDLAIAARYGYRLSSIRPIDVVNQISPAALLIIHGLNDTLIPPEHGRQLFEAAGEPKELWLIEGAEHCGAYFADRPAYMQRVFAFFDQYLGSVDEQVSTKAVNVDGSGLES